MEREFLNAELRTFAERNDELYKPVDEIRKDYQRYLDEVYEDMVADDDSPENTYRGYFNF